MTTAIVIAPPPHSSVCLKDDRMVRLEPVTTDFGGIVDIWVCQRCGVAAILTTGERPGGGNGNVSFSFSPR